MSQLYEKVVGKSTLDLLIAIQSNSLFSSFYLAGGTSLALQLGHRVSVDLDFFTAKEFDANLTSLLDKKKEIISQNRNSIEVWIDDVKVFFFYFAFPNYKKLKTIKNIKFADPIDIGLMKLLALQGRNARKDIIDLYFIDRDIMPLGQLLKIFESHYPKESFNIYDSLKSVLDLSDLDSQPMPKMFAECDWEVCLDLVKSKLTSHFKTLIL